MKLNKIAHIGIAIQSVDIALRTYRDVLGMDYQGTVELTTRGLRIAFLNVGDTLIELLEPLTPTSEISNFLQKRGEGVHHVCFEVDDIVEALSLTEQGGVKLIQREPSLGAEGLPVAFLHPKSCHGVLVEFLEKSGGPTHVQLQADLSGSTP